MIRRCSMGLAAGLFVAGISFFLLHLLSPSFFRAEQSSSPSFSAEELSRERLLKLNQMLAQAPPLPERLVYPYSVIPGGVADAKELKWVAEHDPVVASHYAGFDYDHARVVRLTLAQTVYLSYRIGNRIYWTSHRVTLHKGEKLITDGKITARVRCANQVIQVPQQAADAPRIEPPAVAFDQPIRIPRGTAIQTRPVPFQSALLSGPGLGPPGPLNLYDPIRGGGWVPISPPPVPSGLCAPGKKKGTGESGCCVGGEGGKKKKSPCGGPTGVVPEPSTWVLLGSGLAGIYWLTRGKLVRA
jgi:hypothetical protein